MVVLIWIKCTLLGMNFVEKIPEGMKINEGDVITVVGNVYDKEEKPSSQYIYIKGQVIEGYMSEVNLISTPNSIHGPLNYIVVNSEYNSLTIGQEISVTGKIQYFTVDRNPGNFDAATYYGNQGIEAMVYAQEIKSIDDMDNMGNNGLVKARLSIYKIGPYCSRLINGIYNHLYNIKSTGINHLYTVLGQDKGALLAAMIFGEKSGMDSEQKERFQKIGISHIFAISGLHISLLSLVLYTWIRKRTGSYLLAGIIATIALSLYIMLIGLSISALRAGTMFVIKVIADITGRIYHRGTALAVAAIWILVTTPAYLYDGGFLLSFGAIMSVIFLMPIIQMLLKPYGKIGAALGASIAIQLMLLPIMFQNFYEVSLYSVIVNILVIPCMPLLLGLGILGVWMGGVFSIFGMGISTLLLRICGIVLGMLDSLSHLVLGLPYSRIVLGKLWWPVIIMYYLILISLIIWGRILVERQQIIEDVFGVQEQIVREGINRSMNTEKQMRTYQKCRCRELTVGFLVLPLLLFIKAPSHELEITLIDVGQGDGIHISGPNGGNYLVDGGSTDISNVGTYRIEPYLLSIGVRVLDYVLISHGDSDHMNGVATMLARQDVGVRIKNLVLVEEQFLDTKLNELKDIALENQTKVLIMEAGNTIREGEMSLTCLAPAAEYIGELGNSSSMVLDLSYYDFDMLFTGDLEKEGEREFITYLGAAEEKEYEVLKVSHHGSKNSTPMEFLEYIQPNIAVISAGVNSTYGHPHVETIERISMFTSHIYSTSEAGAIFISYSKNSSAIKVATYLEKG